LASASVASSVIAQRVGPVAFARNGAVLSNAAQNILQTAAQSAAASGRVRLVPAQFAREAAAPELSSARTQAMTEALKRAGLPADRIVVGSDLGVRVDVYDVYVER
jgi:outer membrane protein OmpA-like peptidoglycan-associated protein